jgi:hypothetical protein
MVCCYEIYNAWNGDIIRHIECAKVTLDKTKSDYKR